jgi:Insertion element 4 transposase N-terminal
MEGHCTLSPGQGRRVLDRLTALTELIPEEWVQRSIALAGLVQKRSCVLTPEVMLWVVLAMGLFTDSPIRQVFRQCRRFHGREKIPTRSALCKARKRLGTRAIRNLFKRVVGLCCRFGDSGFYGRYRLMGIDGSLFTIPDTSANERVFGRPKGGSSSRSQGGFPQVGKSAWSSWDRTLSTASG